MNGSEQGLYSYPYPRPSVTVDTLVFTVSEENTLKLLLIKRKHDPFGGWWALPGGFVDMEEDLLTAAKRELWEEAHLRPQYLGQLQTYGAVGRDPRGRTISVAYLAVIAREQAMACAGDDAGEAAWFDVACTREETEKGWQVQLTLSHAQTTLSTVLQLASDDNAIEQQWEVVHNDGLAFDHGKIIADGVFELRQRLVANGGLFVLLPAEFSEAQLWQVYKAIQGQSVAEKEFRQNVVWQIEETGHYRRGVDGMMRRLYRHHPQWQERLLQKGAVESWNW